MPYEALWQQLAILTDHVMQLRNMVSNLQVQQAEFANRMDKMERRQRPKPPMNLRSFLGQVASIRQWIAGGILVALALKGALSPEQFKSILLSFMGVPQ